MKEQTYHFQQFIPASRKRMELEAIKAELATLREAHKLLFIIQLNDHIDQKAANPYDLIGYGIHYDTAIYLHFLEPNDELLDNMIEAEASQQPGLPDSQWVDIAKSRLYNDLLKEMAEQGIRFTPDGDVMPATPAS